jgi:hypothetical protein
MPMWILVQTYGHFINCGKKISYVFTRKCSFLASKLCKLYILWSYLFCDLCICCKWWYYLFFLPKFTWISFCLIYDFFSLFATSYRFEFCNKLIKQWLPISLSIWHVFCCCVNLGHEMSVDCGSFRLEFSPFSFGYETQWWLHRRTPKAE